MRSVCQRYQEVTDRYGFQTSPIFRMRFASGRLRSRYRRWIALTMPRSRAGSTSGRCRRNMRNISAVQRPKPFTDVNRSMTRSSGSAAVRVDPPVSETRAEIAQVVDLLAAESRAAKGFVTEQGYGRGAGNVAAFEQRNEPAEDRGRRLHRKLLTDDSADKGAQMIAALPFGEGARTDTSDGGAEHRIAPHQPSARARNLQV